MRILIPARKGSKGLPGKNRKLFRYTASTIPEAYRELTYVSTDDPEIISLAKEYGLHTHERSEECSTDKASTKEVVLDFLKSKETIHDVLNIMYLTYPQRRWSDVERAEKELRESNSRSLLCSFEINVHPFLMCFEMPNSKGKQIVKHNLYRRQDYPKCFEISHFVSMFIDSEIENLNDNLYNDQTHFMKCEKKIDVDLIEHLERFENAKS